MTPALPEGSVRPEGVTPTGSSSSTLGDGIDLVVRALRSVRYEMLIGDYRVRVVA